MTQAPAAAEETVTPLELLKEWVFELGLPSWDQAEGKLRDSEEEEEEPNDETGAVEEKVGYCCLGVLCELGVRHGLVERSGNQYRWRDLTWTAEWSDGVLPENFSEWLGLSAKDPKVSEECEVHRDEECPDGYACRYRVRATLSAINDAGQPFVFIRDLVQTQIMAPREAEETRNANT